MLICCELIKCASFLSAPEVGDLDMHSQTLSCLALGSKHMGYHALEHLATGLMANRVRADLLCFD